MGLREREKGFREIESGIFEKLIYFIDKIMFYFIF